MFNIGSGEIALIAVVALLILGPSRLPELARGIGKFMREFRRQTDEVRGVVEREFYKMDTELQKDLPPLEIHPANGLVASNPHSTPAEEEAMAVHPEHLASQLTSGMPVPSDVEGPVPSDVEGPVAQAPLAVPTSQPAAETSEAPPPEAPASKS